VSQACVMLTFDLNFMRRLLYIILLCENYAQSGAEIPDVFLSG
jgi:hypothetical protein